MEEVGIRVCRMSSSPTTTVIRKVWRWHLLRHYMDVGVELHYFGMRLENRGFSDLTYCKKMRSKFAWLGRTFESCCQDKRTTPNIGDENYALKLEILFTSRCHLWVVCVISRFEASTCQDSLNHLRFWRREVKYLPIGVTAIVVWCEWRVPYFSTEEMSTCTGRTKVPWKIWMPRKISRIKSTLSRF
jgi:hypothetical protein